MAPCAKRRLPSAAMRIDVALLDLGYARSRTEAKKLILTGAVSVNGIKVLKPSFELQDSGALIAVDRTGIKYVSRGGIKLEKALEAFNITVFDRQCIDIGASSGGFTDCLLQHGAKSVIAVDSGSSQLFDSIRCDPRVFVMEKCNARYITGDMLPYLPDMAIMDVSFISATYIIPSLYDVLSEGGDFVCLVKPQFEVGRQGIGKGGIVKSEALRIEALERVISFSRNVGFEYVAHIVSPILGGDGNTEYLVHFIKRGVNYEAGVVGDT